MSLRSLRALCLTSFFIADVRDGLGPFLGIFLTERHWTPDGIGILMTAGGLAGLLATLPAGFITDTSRNKRSVLALVCILITLSTLLIWFSQQTGVVAASQMITGICAAFVGPLIAGITLGLTGQGGFSAQMGKNEAFNHAGNFMTALIAGGIAWYWGVGDFPADDLYDAAHALRAACHPQRRHRQRRGAWTLLFSEPASARLCGAD